MKKSFCKFIVVLIIVNCQLSIVNLANAQTEVTPGVTFGKKFGVTYILPQTEIVIEATATRQHYEPGQFSQYAERYLRLSTHIICIYRYIHTYTHHLYPYIS